jgi:hypothetical protein
VRLEVGEYGQRLLSDQEEQADVTMKFETVRAGLVPTIWFDRSAGDRR